jgi:hypothetical protein
MRGILSIAVLAAVYIPRIQDNYRRTETDDNVVALQSASEPSDGVNVDFPSHLYETLHEPYASYRCLPKHIHLAQANNVQAHDDGGDDDVHMSDLRVAMTVSFSLDFKNCARAQAVVLYGRGVNGTDNTEGKVTDAKRLQFNYTSDKSNGLYQSDWIYHAELPNLKAGNERYWYRIVVEQQQPSQQQHPSTDTDTRGAAKDDKLVHLRGTSAQRVAGRTPPYVFLTPPLPGAPTTLALVGDLGQTNNSRATMFHIWRAATDMPLNDHPVSNVLIAGDMSYADSDPVRWTSWMDLVEPLVRTTPLSVAAGNHEIECDNVTHQIFVPYEKWFRNPNRVTDADIFPVEEEYRKTLWHGSCSAPSEFQGHYNYGNAFYSYQHGLVQIIVLSSYSDASVGSVQYQWLEQELQTINREITPWLLVSFHAPLYTTFQGHVDEFEAVNMKQAMEPLFVKYGVNIVVSGHDHGYMKSHPLAFGKVDPTGSSPIYLTLGAGGNREEHPPGYRHEEPEAWVAERNLQEYGYGHLFVPNATHALFDWVRDGTRVKGLQDQEWIYNPHYSASAYSMDSQVL